MDPLSSNSGIYGIFCLPTGKVYIGQSSELSVRKMAHLYALRAGRHFNVHLQRAFTLYGEDQFKFRVIELAAPDILNVRELSWASFYGADDPSHGYNLDTPGTARRHSEETRRKISLARRGRKGTPWSEARKQKQSERLRGKPVHPNSEAARRASTLARTGTPLPETVRAKISEAAKKRPGHKKTLEERVAASERMRRAPPETFRPMIEAARKVNTGRIYTEEQRRARGMSSRLAWARRKANKLSVGKPEGEVA